MKWIDGIGCNALNARCGHLFVRIKEHKAYMTPDHPAYEPSKFEWFVEPDDEDKSYRRALASGTSPTAEAAKQDAAAACVVLVTEMAACLAGLA